MEMNVFGTNGKGTSPNNVGFVSSSGEFRTFHSLSDLYFGSNKHVFTSKKALDKLDRQCRLANKVNIQTRGETEVEHLHLFGNVQVMDGWKLEAMLAAPEVDVDQVIQQLYITLHPGCTKLILCGEGHLNTNVNLQNTFAKLAGRIHRDLQRNIKLYEKYKALGKEKRAAIYKDRIDRWTAGVDSSFYGQKYISFVENYGADHYIPEKQFNSDVVKGALLRELIRASHMHAAMGSPEENTRWIRNLLWRPEILVKAGESVMIKTLAQSGGNVPTTISHIFEGFSESDMKNTRQMVDNYLRYRVERAGLQLEAETGTVSLSEDFSFDVRYDWENDAGQKDRLIRTLVGENMCVMIERLFLTRVGRGNFTSHLSEKVIEVPDTTEIDFTAQQKELVLLMLADGEPMEKIMRYTKLSVRGIDLIRSNQ